MKGATWWMGRAGAARPVSRRYPPAVGWLVGSTVALAAATTLLGAWQRSRALRARSFRRGAALALWRRSFPDVPPEELDRFLRRVGEEAFLLRGDRARCLRPTDRVGDLYRADQTGFIADALQLETLQWVMRDAYGVRVAPSDPALTFGDLLGMTRAHAA